MPRHYLVTDVFVKKCPPHYKRKKFVSVLEEEEKKQTRITLSELGKEL